MASTCATARSRPSWAAWPPTRGRRLRGSKCWPPRNAWCRRTSPGTWPSPSRPWRCRGRRSSFDCLASAEQLANRHDETRHLARLQVLVRAGDAGFCELALLRPAKHTHPLARQVQHPVLRDASTGIHARLVPQIEIQRRIGDLNEQDDVFGLGVGVAIEVRAVAEHGEVRLRFRKLAEADGVLTANNEA